VSPHPSISPPDPYAVLGLAPEATRSDIASAYRRLVRALHPDTCRSDPDRLGAVLDAYRLLRDPGRRAAYDRQRRPAYSTIPVRVLRPAPSRGPDLRAGPVRRHPPH
jgi:curved DNA-binding protein CbpA